jgi:predicted nucleic acid-binding Zn ribbon protein
MKKGLHLHRHCVVCGKMVPEDKEFCSVSCEEAYKKREKRYRMTTRIWYLFIIFFVLIFVTAFLAGAG